MLWIADKVQSWWVIERWSHYLDLRKRELSFGLEAERENVGMWKVKQNSELSSTTLSRGEKQVSLGDC